MKTQHWVGLALIVCIAALSILVASTVIGNNQDRIEAVTAEVDEAVQQRQEWKESLALEAACFFSQNTIAMQVEIDGLTISREDLTVDEIENVLTCDLVPVEEEVAAQANTDSEANVEEEVAAQANTDSEAWVKEWKSAVIGKTPQNSVGILLNAFQINETISNCEGYCEVALQEGEVIVVWTDWMGNPPAGTQSLVMGSTDYGFGAWIIYGPWEGVVSSGGIHAFTEGYDITVTQPEEADATNDATTIIDFMTSPDEPATCVPTETLDDHLADSDLTPQGAVTVALVEIPWAEYSVSCASGCTLDSDVIYAVWADFGSAETATDLGFTSYTEWATTDGYGLWESDGTAIEVPASAKANGHKLCPTG